MAHTVAGAGKMKRPDLRSALVREADENQSHRFVAATSHGAGNSGDSHSYGRAGARAYALGQCLGDGFGNCAVSLNQVRRNSRQPPQATAATWPEIG